MLNRLSSRGTNSVSPPPIKAPAKEALCAAVDGVQAAAAENTPELLQKRIDAIFQAAKEGEEGATVLQSARSLVADVFSMQPAIALGLVDLLVTRSAMFLDPDADSGVGPQVRRTIDSLLRNMVRPAMANLEFRTDQPDLRSAAGWKARTLATIDELLEAAPRPAYSAQAFEGTPRAVLNHMDDFRTKMDSARAAGTSRVLNEMHQMHPERKNLLLAIDKLGESSSDKAKAVYQTYVLPELQALAQIDRNASNRIAVFRSCWMIGCIPETEAWRTLAAIDELLFSKLGPLGAGYSRDLETARAQVAYFVDGFRTGDNRPDIEKVILSVEVVLSRASLYDSAQQLAAAMARVDTDGIDAVRRTLGPLRAALHARLT